MSVTGLPGQGPVRAGIPVADLATGLYCAIGVLIALLERERTGRGRWVHTSLLESMVAMMDFQATRWTMKGEVPRQVGNDHPTTVPTGLFHTADGVINLEDPVRFNRIVGDFLAQVDAGRWPERDPRATAESITGMR